MHPKWSRFVWCFLFFLLYACSSPPSSISAGSPTSLSIDVFFSPHGGATEAVVHELGNAKNEILVQAYSFTSAPIAKALVDAYKWGVKVTVALDRRSTSSSRSATSRGITKRLAT
jgi:phosphatidylserine/phosphatidylglycerophosphate/cardiolipin synthase-like enzyme